VAHARTAAPSRTHDVQALLLRRVAVGESDLIVSLFTDAAGRISALARGARRSQRRFAGALEPFHTLRARLEEREGRDLWTLTEASLAVPRHRLVERLARLEAAGRGLAWVREGLAEHNVEPAVFADTIHFLDALDGLDDEQRAPVELAELGLRLLGRFGWALELGQCVRCGARCGPGRAAMVSAHRGGLVCRACGGASLLLQGPERARLVRAGNGERSVLTLGDAARALALVDEAMQAHAGRR
jgi:DNA repair protein RecO (recombination protein O)